VTEAATTTEAVIEHVLSTMRGESSGIVVKAPPGSGKTYLLVQASKAAVERDRTLRIAIACQTNSQADDVCRRLAAARIACVRLASSEGAVMEASSLVAVIRSGRDLPDGGVIVVATSKKWSMGNAPTVPFDVMLIDEAWQLGFGDFTALTKVTGRFVLVGDPGQIAPVMSIDTARWSELQAGPQMPTPEALLALHPGMARVELTHTRRLSHETAAVVRNFYDFDFKAVAQPGDRRVHARLGGSHRRLGEVLSETGLAMAELPTPDGGPPEESDRQLAASVAEIVQALLEAGTEVTFDGETKRLEPVDIGIVATHRILNTELKLALATGLREQVRVDTAERWQGLERRFMVAVHPLSGCVSPSEFDLGTGRLCVMASRHQCGLLVVTRDHVGQTLEQALLPATQPLGKPDVAGRGLASHRRFREYFVGRGAAIDLR
jgi:hypothetical protein